MTKSKLTQFGKEKLFDLPEAIKQPEPNNTLLSASTPEPEVIMPQALIIDDSFLKTRPLSYSSLKSFDVSPKDYYYYITEPDIPPSDAMILGRAIECLVFEPDKFPAKFWPYEKFERRSVEAKQKWMNMVTQAGLQRKTLIEESEVKKANECAEAVRSNVMIQPYLNAITRTQTRLEWFEKQYNLPMKGYSDIEGNYNGDFVGEFKTTQDASDDGWIRQAFQMKYHIQIGCYSRGYHRKFYRFPNYFFILCETKEPYKSNIFFCPSKYVDQCQQEVEYLLVSFRYCMDNNLFHQGYEFWSQSMPYNTMTFPGYAKLRSKI